MYSLNSYGYVVSQKTYLSQAVTIISDNAIDGELEVSVVPESLNSLENDFYHQTPGNQTSTYFQPLNKMSQLCI